jgi:AcrR family transcriptional regulator
MNSPAELPLLVTEATERADATRNRERILCAARRLFDERGVGSVSMDDVA